jgi:hypothetical protein
MEAGTHSIWINEQLQELGLMPNFEAIGELQIG